MLLSKVKTSLINACFVNNNKKINRNKLRANRSIFSAICEGKITVDKTTETPTETVKKLADQYTKIPKNGFVFFKTVKEAYPEIAEMLKKEVFKNRDKVSVDEIIEMINELEPDEKFWISFDKWDGAQKDLSQQQVVVQLNMDDKLRKEIESDETIDAFFTTYYKDTTEQHPAHSQTLGWARVYKFPDKWIIEEIQTDLLSADTKISNQLEDVLKEFTPEQIETIGAFLKKHFVDWDKKLVSAIIDMARNEDVTSIYIFDEDFKKKYSKSKSKLKRFYREVPRDLGFKRDTLEVDSREIPAWKRAVASNKGITNHAT